MVFWDAVKMWRERALLANFFMLVSRLAYASTSKMEATCSSEASVDFQQTIRRCIPEDNTLSHQRCENLKCYILGLNYFCTQVKENNKELKRKWYAHVMRMDDCRTARQVADWNPQRKRRRGRPVNTWKGWD
jgi:hypothetical protein